MFFIEVFLEKLIFFHTRNVFRKTHNSTLRVCFTVVIGSVSDIKIFFFIFLSVKMAKNTSNNPGQTGFKSLFKIKFNVCKNIQFVDF